MTHMGELLQSGRVVDLALAVLGLEVALLFAMRQRGNGLAPIDVLCQLASGALLLLALRVELTGGDHRLTLALLSASFPAHLFDLARRARGQSKAWHP